MIKLENEATQAVAAGASPVSLFENPEFGSVRIIVKENGEPLFCGKDVATCLGYSDQAQAVRDRIDDEDKGVVEITTPGGNQKVTFINESGLYSLILGSKLDSAKKFKRWVTSEVLPSIRKTGSYSVDQQHPSYQIEDSIERAKAWIKEEEQRRLLTVENKKLTTKIEEDAPKLDVYNQFIASKNNVHIRTFVKMIQDRFPKVREAWIFKSLREAGILQSHGFFKNIPYAEYGPTGKGYFALKQSAFGATPLLTPKGQEWCYKMIKDYYEAAGDVEDMFEEDEDM